MKPSQLILKCYAERDSGVWVAVCLDFNLAAQGESFDEVKAKIEAMIDEYVYDALVGEDKAYADQLLTRRAPIPVWLRYYFLKLKHTIFNGAQDYLFNETMPLRPA
jgi:predicted RNase H-like HicB family nuclease